ncbi:MAG TPA: hypothetical protein VGG28_29180 [Kofleriaceae bacterium]|jgi:hypothetical protein
MPERVALLAVAHALLGAVDELPLDARGAFVVTSGDDERGAVFVEHNRVCWATAHGLERRLRELLGTGAAPAALRQHSIESLTALCGPDSTEIAWVPRQTPLAAPTSFAPTDLLAAVGARLYSAEYESATASHLSGTSGASFAIDDDGDSIVVREIAGERLGVATLLELGAWAAAALDATPGFTAPMIERALADARGSVVLGWRTARRVIHAAVFEDREVLAGTMDAMKHRRVPVVVSVRNPWKLKT